MCNPHRDKRGRPYRGSISVTKKTYDSFKTVCDVRGVKMGPTLEGLTNNYLNLRAPKA